MADTSNKEQNTLNVFFAINDAYVEPAKTMLQSLLVNNDIFVKAYLLHKHLSREKVEDLKCFVSSHGHGRLIEIQIPESSFNDAPKLKWWSEETYYRLLASDLIPEDRALWLDADVIVNKSITDFYSQDISDVYAVVCKGSNQTGKERLGLPESHVYFNSGVILYNLKLLRKRLDAQDIFDCLNQYKDKLSALDQDILNILFSEHICYADEQIYNHETLGFSVLTREEMNCIFHKACIIHFIGPLKPWNYKGANWADKLWWKYERQRGRTVQYVKYKILNFPTKLYYICREIIFIGQAQINKLVSNKH